jgi:hypothetical protein
MTETNQIEVEPNQSQIADSKAIARFDSDSVTNLTSSQKGRNPNSLANLKNGVRFKAGEVANPGGRPKTSEFRQYLLDFLGAKSGAEKLKLVKHMAKCRPEILLYYCYGKPVESIELSGKEGGAIEFKSAAQLRAEMILAGEMDASGHLVTRN